MPEEEPKVKTPPSRTFVVPYEDRTYTVPPSQPEEDTEGDADD